MKTDSIFLIGLLVFATVVLGGLFGVMAIKRAIEAEQRVKDLEAAIVMVQQNRDYYRKLWVDSKPQPALDRNAWIQGLDRERRDSYLPPSSMAGRIAEQ